MFNLKFLVDECVGVGTAQWLKTQGFDAVSILEETPGIPDEEVLRRAQAENRIIITSDKDFGDLIFFYKNGHCGIILLRLKDESIKNKIKTLDDLLKDYAAELKNNFIVASNTQVKIIRQPSH